MTHSVTWADFYLICFAVGFCLSFFSFVLGGGGHSGRLHLQHFHGHAGGAHLHSVGVPAAHGPGASHPGLPRAPQWAEPVWHLYVVRAERRAALMAALDGAGIGALIHYPIPPHLQQAYADLGWPADSQRPASVAASDWKKLPPNVQIDVKPKYIDVVLTA